MNQIMPSVCALALIAGCTCLQAQDICVKRALPVGCAYQVVCDDSCIPPPLKVNVCGCYDAYREPYRIDYPPICPTPSDLVTVGNTPGALAIRRTAILRQRANVRFEKEMLAASTPIVQPSSTGTVIFGETEGAGVFESGRGCPPPAPRYPGPKCFSRPSVVGERVIIGTPVPGKPGFVYCPYARGSGYIDIRGLEPGSLAKDPYSGRTFRVP